MASTCFEMEMPLLISLRCSLYRWYLKVFVSTSIMKVVSTTKQQTHHLSQRAHHFFPLNKAYSFKKKKGVTNPHFYVDLFLPCPSCPQRFSKTKKSAELAVISSWSTSLGVAKNSLGIPDEHRGESVQSLTF